MIATNVAPLELRCGSTDAPVPARRTILLSAGDITITAESKLQNLIFGTDNTTNISECEFPTGTAAILGIEYRSFFHPLFRNDSRPYRVDRRRNRRLMQHGKEPSLIASLYR